MSFNKANATPAHAEMPEDNHGTAFTASGSGRYEKSTLRGMMDSGCYPNMRRNDDGLSSKAKVNIQVRVAKQGVGELLSKEWVV